MNITHAETGVGPSNKVTAADWEAAHVITGGLQKATVTLSSADILDLHNTPVTLVAAPGAGKWLSVSHASASLTYGTATYAGGSPTPRWKDGAGAEVNFNITDPGSTIAGATASSVASGPADTNGILASADVVNQPLILTSGIAMTTGDSTIAYTVQYTIEDMP